MTRGYGELIPCLRSRCSARADRRDEVGDRATTHTGPKGTGRGLRTRGALSMAAPPSVAKKIRQARLFIGLARAENQAHFPDQEAVEAFLAAFLSAAQAAFYRLQAGVGREALECAHEDWWASLNDEDRVLLTRLIGLRHRDVHRDDPEVAVREGAIPVEQLRGAYIAAPAGLLIPNPIPGGVPAFATGWMLTQQVELAAADLDGCARALDLLAGLVDRFDEGEATS